MDRPVAARLAELSRVPAWPLLGWAILDGRVQADLELLLLKDFGTPGATAERLFADDFTLARQGAQRLRWQPDWTRSVLREGLVLTLAATGLSMRQLRQEDLDELRGAIDASPLLTPFGRRRKGQLFGLAQLLFECRLLEAPPALPGRSHPSRALRRLARLRATHSDDPLRRGPSCGAGPQVGRLADQRPAALR